jgi:hypothetical protein
MRSSLGDGFRVGAGLGTGLLPRSPAAGIDRASSFRVTVYTPKIPNTHPEPSMTGPVRNDFSVWLPIHNYPPNIN